MYFTLLFEVDTEKAIKLYLEKRLPVWTIASISRRNIFDIWFDFTKNSDLGIYCSTGNHDERSEALSFIKRDLKLIVDPLSILTIVTLNVGDTIINHFGKLGVARSTLDLFQQAILVQSRMYYRSHSVLIYNGGDIIMQEVSAESIQKTIEKLECVLEWIYKNCEVLPCKRALSIKREEKIKYDKLIGRVFVDTILIASEENNILYSEEKLLRDIAKQDFDTYGIWTQALLYYCLDNNLIERDQFNEKTIELANLHYYHTNITAEILLDAAKKASWKLAPPFTDVLKILENKHCNENSALNVSSYFIYLMRKEQIYLDDFYVLFMNLLNTIVNGRWPPSVISKLRAIIESRFDLFSLEDSKQIFELIETWEMIFYGQIV